MRYLTKIKSLGGKPFSAAQAKTYGISRHALREMVQEGLIEKLSRGIYRTIQSDISEEDGYRTATLRVGKSSAICLISALSYYNLTDTIPKKIWIMVLVSKRASHKDLKVYRKRNPKWNIGIEKKDGYSITSLERTIVEVIVDRSHLGSQIGLEALKRAISEKKTTLGKIIDMATQLKVIHRIQAYVEAFS